MKKQIFLITYAFLMLQVVACGQEKKVVINSTNAKEKQKQTIIDSGLVKIDFPEVIPIEYQSYRSRDIMLPKTKNIGNTQLFFKDGNYVIYNNCDGYTHTEIIPNVILLDKTGKGIEFYDKEGRNLLKKLDYSDNPYLKKGIDNLTVGFPDMEYYHFIGNDDIGLVKEKTTQYFTDFRIFYSKHNFVAIAYSLIGATEENRINKYEYTVCLYNKEGKKVNEVKINHAIEEMIVSDDGRYLCLTYGGGGNGDVISPETNVFTIYDIKERGYIMEEKAFGSSLYYHIGGIDEVAPNFISTGHYSSLQSDRFYAKDMIIDLTSRVKYSKEYYSRNELDEKRKEYFRVGRKAFYQKNLFNQQKI